MATALTIALYVAVAIFAGRVLSRIVLLWRVSGTLRALAQAPAKTGPAVFLKAAADVLFFGRLLRVNPRLWVGEFVFHVSLGLVLFEHLRYVISPVPLWFWRVQPVAAFAGYTLLGSIGYILFVRLVLERVSPLFRQNIFLLALTLLTGTMGVLMLTVLRVDLVAVKAFVMGAMAVRPEAPPASAAFVAHLFFALTLLVYLPSHALTAPFVMVVARRREESLGTVMHE